MHYDSFIPKYQEILIFGQTFRKSKCFSRVLLVAFWPKTSKPHSHGPTICKKLRKILNRNVFSKIAVVFLYFSFLLFLDGAFCFFSILIY